MNGSIADAPVPGIERSAATHGHESREGAAEKTLPCRQLSRRSSVSNHGRRTMLHGTFTPCLTRCRRSIWKCRMRKPAALDMSQFRYVAESRFGVCLVVAPKRNCSARMPPASASWAVVAEKRAATASKIIFRPFFARVFVCCSSGCCWMWLWRRV